MEASVTEEMLDAVTFDHYQGLIDLYLDDPEFSKHILIKISLKLYSLLMSLANQSKSTTLFIEQKKIKLSKYYGEQLDLDDRVYGKNWVQFSKMLKENRDDVINEEMVFFMFILKISKKIEVAVHPPSLEKPITKEIYYPLMPETFYLEEKTKDDTLKEIDVENRRADFQRRYPQYFIEMEQNYKLSLSAPLIYAISKNDTLSKLKLFYYTIGLALNILVLIFYKLVGDSTNPDSRQLVASDTGDSIITWISAIFSGVTFVNFLIWLFFRAGAEYKAILPKYSMKNPTVQMPPNFATSVNISIFWVFFRSADA